MSTQPTPSAEALALAVKLSGHEGTQCKYGARICEGCIADARTIDRELQLPARNAALLCAQSVCDTEEKYVDGCKAFQFIDNITPAIEELRGALARISSK